MPTLVFLCHRDTHRSCLVNPQLPSRIIVLDMSTQTFPQDPILERLVAAIQRVAEPAPLIHDVMGYSKGYPHLLGDILATRKRLLEQLPETVLQKNELLKDDFVYVFLLCQSGYEYLVGFFAIRAIGGAVMPLGMFLGGAMT